jgi:hypothetical protein
MEKIIRREFNAKCTSIVLHAGEYIRGRVAHSSRTGLSGIIEHKVRPTDLLVSGFRSDSLPCDLPETFFVFKGHGSNPTDPILFHREAENIYSATLLDIQSECPAPEKPVPAPWWAQVADVFVPECAYQLDVAWALWRAQTPPCGGPCRHGVIVDAIKVFSELDANDAHVRLPFFLSSESSDWALAPPKEGATKDLGLIISRYGHFARISCWSLVAKNFYARLATGERAEDLYSSVVSYQGILLDKNYGTPFVIGCKKFTPKEEGIWFECGGKMMCAPWGEWIVLPERLVNEAIPYYRRINEGGFTVPPLSLRIEERERRGEASEWYGLATLNA